MKSRKPSIPYIIWMVVFTMIPIIMIGFTAFTDKNGNFSLQAFTNAFYYTNIFVKSLWIALISTAICLVLAYPLAYLLTRMKESTQNTLIMLLMIPMWMNFLLRIYAWVTLLQDNGPIDMMLSLLGIHSTYIGNTGAVILGMVYEYLPGRILSIRLFCNFLNLCIVLLYRNRLGFFVHRICHRNFCIFSFSRCRNCYRHLTITTDLQIHITVLIRPGTF